MIVGPAPGPLTRDGAREAAQRELSKAIYHRYDEPWTVRVLRAVLHAIDRVLSAAANHAPGGGVGAILLVLAAAVLIGLARWRLGPMQHDRRRRAVGADDPSVTAEDHRRLARAAAGGADWHTAVVEGMRAIARELEERGWLDVRPGRTADELAAAVAALAPELSEAVTAAATTFDAVAYGGRSATESAFRTVSSADEALRRMRQPVAVPA